MATALHIIPGPDVRTETEHTEDKWCFACRKRGSHRWVVYSDSRPSYYEPIGAWECPRCGKDKTRFGDGI